MQYERNEMVVDVAFPLIGKSLPLDHGYPLFGAVSRVLPRLHREPGWALHPVFGRRLSPGVLGLLRQSHLTLRLPTPAVGEVLTLTGRHLDVAGHGVRTGPPRIYPLNPMEALRSRFVTIKKFHEEPDAFSEAVRRQLSNMEIDAVVDVEVKERRVMRVAEHVIVGFPIVLKRLSPSDSIKVQSSGLGGRRHMGAGVFIAPRAL